MVFASPTLMHTLIAADLVDDYRLTIQPVLVGSGLPLFVQIEQRRQLRLADSRTFSNGVIGAHYAVKR
jgi:dihydrofolate reductase